MRLFFARLRLIALSLYEDVRAARRELRDDVRSVTTGDVR
jgi:hypothetical protein